MWNSLKNRSNLPGFTCLGSIFEHVVYGRAEIPFYRPSTVQIEGVRKGKGPCIPIEYVHDGFVVTGCDEEYRTTPLECAIAASKRRLVCEVAVNACEGGRREFPSAPAALVTGSSGLIRAASFLFLRKETLALVASVPSPLA